MSLASVKPCPVLGSAFSHESPTGNERLNLGVGEGEAALTIFLLLPTSQIKWRVSGSFSTSAQNPWPLLTTGSGREGKPSQLLAYETCPHYHVSYGGWRDGCQPPLWSGFDLG